MIEALGVVLTLLIIATLIFGPSALTVFAFILMFIGILFVFAYFGDFIVTVFLILVGILIVLYIIGKVSSGDKSE